MKTLKNPNSNQYNFLPCPECEFPIPVSIVVLLSGQPLCCGNPECGIELNVDGTKSGKGLDEVKKLQHAVNELEKVKEQVS